jgi:hypothetical protein
MPVILRCPNCNNSFLNYQERTYTLNQKELNELFNEGCPEKINDYFKNIIESKLRVFDNFSGRPERSNCIGKEDILDLKIEIEIQKSVDDFLKII